MKTSKRQKTTMIKFIMYKKIQNYKKNGLTKAEIVRQTGRDAKTVRKK